MMIVIVSMMLILNVVMKRCNFNNTLYNIVNHNHCMNFILRMGKPIESIGETISGPTQLS